MITKYKYTVDASGKVSRKEEYSFTSLEGLQERLSGVTDIALINGLVNRTILGESERPLIEAEDLWFKLQVAIQDMIAERKTLEELLLKGDSKGNPLVPERVKAVSARIADLKEGTQVIKKEFYDHYTRTTMVVDEIIQTPFTKALEARTDAETKTPFLSGLRGVKTAPARPAAVIDPAKETMIRKEFVRQKIGVTVGDDKDLIADMANVVSLLIKKTSGQSLTAAEDSVIAKYVTRQSAIATILATDYKK